MTIKKLKKIVTFEKLKKKKMNDSEYDSEKTEYIVYAPKGVLQHTTKTINQQHQIHFTLEPKAKNVENIEHVTQQTQLRELCPVWKTSFSPQTTPY